MKTDKSKTAAQEQQPQKKERERYHPNNFKSCLGGEVFSIKFANGITVDIQLWKEKEHRHTLNHPLLEDLGRLFESLNKVVEAPYVRVSIHNEKECINDLFGVVSNGPLTLLFTSDELVDLLNRVRTFSCED